MALDRSPELKIACGRIIARALCKCQYSVTTQPKLIRTNIWATLLAWPDSLHNLMCLLTCNYYLSAESISCLLFEQCLMQAVKSLVMLFGYTG